VTPDQIRDIWRHLTVAEQAALADMLQARRAEKVARKANLLNLDRWSRDPVAWARDRLSEHMWSKQTEIMDSLQVNRRTAVKSCHGIGKSHVASRAAAWWLDTHAPGTAFVVSTAPTFPQVQAILWRYIGQAHRKGGLIGRVNQTSWFYDTEIIGYGRKPADYNESAFQGIHAKHVLVILDEACGIPVQLWVAADALTTNIGCRILAIGNPDNPATQFKHVTDSRLWHTITISAFDSPNLTGEDVPAELAELLISREWVEEKLEEWGEDSPLYLSKVLGQFPKDDPGKVIRWSHLVACLLARDEEPEPEALTPVQLGVDVAGGGRDETVIRERRGMVAGREWAHRSDDSEVVAAHVVDAVEESGATSVKVDSTGIGWGVVGLIRSQLRAKGIRCEVVAVNASERPSKAPKKADGGRPVEGLRNVRAEMWWLGRELSRTRAWDLSSMANADATTAQLAEPTWSIDGPSGLITVEPKADVISRLGRSPDNADALLLAFYERTSLGDAYVKALERIAEQDGGSQDDEHRPGPDVQPRLSFPSVEGGRPSR
jgi:hypothetical protein